MAIGTERARTTLRRLQHDITSGRWPVHSRIPTEPELSAELGVGRSTVREAVRTLAHLGMLEPTPGRGTYVRSLNPVGTVLATFVSEHSPTDLLAARQAVEVQSALRAAGLGSEDWSRLEAALASETAALKALETTNSAGSTWDRPMPTCLPGPFHTALVEIGGNPLLLELHGALTTALGVAANRGQVLSELDRDRCNREHALILAAITAGDSAAAMSQTVAHAARTRAVITVAVAPTAAPEAPRRQVDPPALEGLF